MKTAPLKNISGTKAVTLDKAPLRNVIDKEDINQLPLTCWEGPTYLLRTGEEIEAAATRLSQATLLGFDTETRPAFRKGQKFLPSLLQLATDKEVYLIQLDHSGFPDSLRQILEEPNIIKAGVAPDFDLVSLQQLRAFQPSGFVDLAKIARNKGVKNRGLRGLAAALCGVRISKSARISNWASNELSPQQIRYAATDAWIGLVIYQQLSALPPLHKQDAAGKKANNQNRQ